MVFSAVIIDRYIYRMIDEGYKAMRDGRLSLFYLTFKVIRISLKNICNSLEFIRIKICIASVF